MWDRGALCLKCKYVLVIVSINPFNARTALLQVCVVIYTINIDQFATLLTYMKGVCVSGSGRSDVSPKRLRLASEMGVKWEFGLRD